jgi:hypothetical protein
MLTNRLRNLPRPEYSASAANVQSGIQHLLMAVPEYTD